MPRFLTAAFLGALGVAVVATPAFAHVELTPSSANAGETVEFTLFAENEQPDAAITQIELQFPEAAEIILADLPTPEGWTVEVVDGEVGGPVGGVTWAGGSEPEDAEFPLTLGPLPDEPRRLQFKAIVTYDNGEEDAWIADWPEGAEEPENPGPIVDVVAAGDTVTTATEEEHDDEEATETTATIAGSDEEASDEDEDDEGNLLGILIGVAVIIAVGAGATWLYMRRRSAA